MAASSSLAAARCGGFARSIEFLSDTSAGSLTLRSPLIESTWHKVSLKQNQSKSQQLRARTIEAALDTPLQKKSGTQLREEYFLAAATGKERGLPKGSFLNDDVVDGPPVEITFEPYGDTCTAPEGSSLLKAAVDAGALTIDQRFCLTGQCDVCILEMDDGEVLRSCMKPVPSGRQRISCMVLDTDDAWGQMMV